MHRRRSPPPRLVGLAAVLATLLLLATQATPASSAPGGSSIAVLSDPADAYDVLAREIAATERSRHATTIKDALACEPEFLLWVSSPPNLSEAALCAMGRALHHRRPSVSVGIITGSTVEAARSLWLRRQQVKSGRELEIIGARAVIDHSRPPAESSPLEKHRLVGELPLAAYVHYSGHGSSRGWECLRSPDVPDLGPLVIGTASCRTMAPWLPDNIALRFVDRGAAAYVGFISSPVGEYMIGEHGGMPFARSWLEFPIGHIVQVQTRGTLQAFARFPQYFLLGDPRAALAPEAPYRVARDDIDSAARVLRLEGLPSGAVPVRIPGGARYSFLSVSGAGATWRGQQFFNARLQMADLGEAKYALVDQPGGTLTIHLHECAPLPAIIGQNVLDFLDHRLVGNESTSRFTAFGAVVALGVIARGLLRRRLTLRRLLTGMALGVAVAAIGWTFAWLRIEHVRVTAVPRLPVLLDLAATIALTTGGFVLFSGGRSNFRRTLALLLAAFPGWVVPLLLLPLATILQTFVRRPAIVYEHHAAQWIGLVHALAALAFFACVFRFASRGRSPPRPPR